MHCKMLIPTIAVPIPHPIQICNDALISILMAYFMNSNSLYVYMLVLFVNDNVNNLLVNSDTIENQKNLRLEVNVALYLKFMIINVNEYMILGMGHQYLMLMTVLMVYVNMNFVVQKHLMHHHYELYYCCTVVVVQLVSNRIQVNHITSKCCCLPNAVLPFDLFDCLHKIWNGFGYFFKTTDKQIFRYMKEILYYVGLFKKIKMNNKMDK